jgi:hypothetical protein
MTPADADRLRNIRAAIERELRLLDRLLPHVTNPARKRSLAEARGAWGAPQSTG